MTHETTVVPAAVVTVQLFGVMAYTSGTTTARASTASAGAGGGSGKGDRRAGVRGGTRILARGT
jgi:hypothetical protein